MAIEEEGGRRRKPRMALAALDRPIREPVAYDLAFLWSLVLSAAAIPHLVEQGDAGWLLKTAAAEEEAALREIEGFEAENRHWPPPPPAGGSRIFSPAHRHPPTVLLMGSLLIFYRFTGSWDTESFWFQKGAVVSRKIFGQHEWWRLLTGLTLHADSVHLLGNAVIGGVLIHFLCQLLGSGLGWTLVLLAGILGNGMNVLFHTGGQNSVGFSTAVFGAVGALSGLNLVSRAGGFRNLLLSLGGGVALLALLGTGSERTDLGSHLWGLTAGLGLGMMIALRPSFVKWCLRPFNQVLLLAFCLAAVWGSWLLALEG